MALPGHGIYVGGVPRGVVYIFPKKGDVLPNHSHEEADNHITVVTWGGIRLTGERDGEEHWAEPGKAVILEWRVGEVHGAIALADNTVIANIRMN